MKTSIREELYELVSGEVWCYDIPGYITKQDLIEVIREDCRIPKEAMLNVRIEMDAANYYAQSGEMKDVAELILSL
jgi:hypothetical protein